MKRIATLVMLGIGLSLASCMSQGTFCDSVKDVPKSECSALSDFFHVTDGPTWKDHRGWLESPNVCDWFGVSCTDDHVTGLSMNYVNIGGQLPASIVGLEHLEVLSLYYNEISGSIPPELGELKKLQVLILHNNHLSGSLPPELGKLSNLSLLDLDGNDLTGPIPPEYGNLRNLEGLKLRNNNLSGQLPAELGNLDHLQGLWLSTNDFSGEVPAEWSGMTSLRMFAGYGNAHLGPLPPYLASLPPDGYPSWANPNIP
jgi:Leucine-rich repeat (LRR) protein